MQKQQTPHDEWSAARSHNLPMADWSKCHLYFRRRLIAGDCSVRLDPAGTTDQTGIIKFHGGSWRASKKYDVRVGDRFVPIELTSGGTRDRLDYSYQFTSSTVDWR
jgi:hypothetical protein